MRIINLVVTVLVLGACGSAGDIKQPVATSSTNTATQAAIEFVQVTATPVIPTVTPTQERRDLENGRPLAARLNNQPLYLDVYREQVEKFNTVLNDEARTGEVERQVLENLLTQLIIEQQAGEFGLIVTEAEVELEADNALSQFAAEDVELWFEKNNLTRLEFLADLRDQLLAAKLFEYVTKDVRVSVEQIQLRYIRVDNETVARDVIAKLKNGEPFEILAQAYSLDAANAENGKELDWLAPGGDRFPEEVKSIAFSLQPGEVSGPIYSSDGLYIIKLEDRDPARLLSDNDLLNHKNKMFNNWLKEQRLSTKIEKFVALH